VAPDQFGRQRVGQLEMFGECGIVERRDVDRKEILDAGDPLVELGRPRASVDEPAAVADRFGRDAPPAAQLG
jgi:hypothetical protein